MAACRGVARVNRTGCQGKRGRFSGLPASTNETVAESLSHPGHASSHACVDDGAVPIARSTVNCGRLLPPLKGRQSVNAPTSSVEPFLSDVRTLRSRARQHVAQGVVSQSYRGDVQATLSILQAVLATEIVCVLRYTQNAIAAHGLNSEGVKAEFLQHAREEQDHVLQVAERINQLGGEPDFDPTTLTQRSASEYVTHPDLVGMITENLVAERIAVDHYRELIRYFADNDPTTRRMIEGILAVEEEHATDMLDLLAKQDRR